MPHHVVALVTPPISLFELACVVEVFGLPRNEFEDWYKLTVASSESASLPLTAGGFRIADLAGTDVLDSAETIIIPGYPLDRTPTGDELNFLKEARLRGARILSICTGSFLLAAAGLLDGKAATTHWAYASEFAARFPNVRLDPDVLYVDEGKIITSAGSAAGIDMLLHVIRMDLGSEATNMVARRLNMAPHRDGGQAQFIPRPVPNVKDTRINNLIAWMRDNCASPMTIPELASRVAMSPRSFHRHFKAATGHAPYDWLLRERVAVAMAMLEDPRISIDKVAFESGFNSADSFRTQFQRSVGINPAQYRQMFGDRLRGAACETLAA